MMSRGKRGRSRKLERKEKGGRTNGGRGRKMKIGEEEEEERGGG